MTGNKFFIVINSIYPCSFYASFAVPLNKHISLVHFQLLSPEDLLNACEMFELLRLPVRWMNVNMSINRKPYACTFNIECVSVSHNPLSLHNCPVLDWRHLTVVWWCYSYRVTMKTKSSTSPLNWSVSHFSPTLKIHCTTGFFLNNHLKYCTDTCKTAKELWWASFKCIGMVWRKTRQTGVPHCK